jgi:hypothetical protein
MSLRGCPPNGARAGGALCDPIGRPPDSPSRLSQSKRGAEVLEFDTCALRCETPIGFGVFLVAIGFPISNLSLEESFVSHPAVEALGGENTQFGLCQVEPAAMFRRVMPFKLDQTTLAIGCESLV